MVGFNEKGDNFRFRHAEFEVIVKHLKCNIKQAVRYQTKEQERNNS